MSALTVGFEGTGPVLVAVRDLLRASPLEIEVAADSGSDHPADVVVTSTPAPAGTFLGVADPRQPNVFYTGDATAPARLVAGYIVSAIEEMIVAGAVEMRVRGPIARSWAGYAAANHGGGRKLIRKLKRFDPADYDYRSAHDDEDIYDGAAVIEHDLESVACRIRVGGYFDPLDGHYHWAGIAFGESVRELKEARARDVLVAIDTRDGVPARLTEITPWGSVRIVGVGQPPYALDDVEVLRSSPEQHSVGS